MSFFSLKRAELKQALDLASQISLNKSEVEIFTQSKIEINSDMLIWEVLNADSYLKTNLTIENLNLEEQLDLKFLLNTHLIHEIVNLIPDEKIGFEVNLQKNSVQVQGNKSRHILRIQTDKLSTFSTPQKSKEQTEMQVKVKVEELLPALKVAMISVGKPKNVFDAKFLNVCLDLNPSENLLNIASTDRYRITKTQIKNPIQADPEFQSIISKKYLLLPKLLNYLGALVNGQEIAELEFTKERLWVKSAQSELALKLSEGDYPDYNKILPQTFSCSFDLKITEIGFALKQVYLLARKNTLNKTIILKLQPSQSKMLLEAKTENGEESQAEIEISNYQGTEEDWQQSFNANYLLDYVNNSNFEDLTWESNPGKPAVLSPKDKKDWQLYLVSGLK